MPLGVREQPTLLERWPLERIFGIVGFVGGVIAVVFSLGVNWQRLSTVDAQLQAHQRYAEQTYVRRDVEGESLQRIEDQLAAITQQNADLRRELNALLQERR